MAIYNLVYLVDMESFIRLSGQHVFVFGGDYWVIITAIDSVLHSSGRQICRIKGSHNNKVILYAINSVLYSFGPFTIMLITNFAIAFKFMRAKCYQNKNAFQ